MWVSTTERLSSYQAISIPRQSPRTISVTSEPSREQDSRGRLSERRILALCLVLLLGVYLINLAFSVGIPVRSDIRVGSEHTRTTRPFIDNYNPTTLRYELMSVYPHIVKA